VAELLSEKLPTPVVRLGVRDRFAESGRPAELFAKYEINSSAVVRAAKKIIKRY
jgi:transketolase